MLASIGSRHYRLLARTLHPVIWAGFGLGALLAPGIRRRFGESFGRVGVPGPAGDVPRIWIHAVSVGEVGVALALVRALEAAGRPVEPCLSTTTATGQGVAARALQGRRLLFHAPWDFPAAVGRSLDRIRPAAMVFTETELWPNWVSACAARGIPVFLFNGRLSVRSFARYRKIPRLMGQTLGAFTSFGMAGAGDAQRLEAIGAPRDRIRVLGNAKFDGLAERCRGVDDQAVREEFGLAPGTPVLVAGSTRTGEEEILLDLLPRWRAACPGLVFVLAPRHPNRRRKIERLLRSRGLGWQRRTALLESGGRRESDLILLDTVGELFRLYAAADWVYCGASLVPKGGQNAFEPAAWGKPVFFGPHMEDFDEVRDLLVEADGAVQVSDGRALGEAVERALRRPEDARAMGKRAREALAGRPAAGPRHAAALAEILETGGGPRP
ncbi:MAG: 3-deoxy-D-manno-octulosonic acid transferase [Puniceicoccaceae bacterium]|nr:MAG: 3-deoxy-D-manno-octulosonic acid transferase [Puniceicoccaceae bacterium]